MSDNTKMYTVLAGGVVILWLSGFMLILGGIIAGALIVGALMMTIERIPGFWKFATNPVGTVIVLFGTAWITHKAIGTDSVTGMIALCASLIIKVIVIDAKKRQLRGA